MTKQRLTNLRKIIAKYNFDAILISDPADIIYLTSYSGFSKSEREVFMLITNKSNYLFTDGRYKEAVKTYIPDTNLVLTTPKQFFYENLKVIVAKENLTKIAIDETNINIFEYKKIIKIIKVCPDLKVIKNLREIKDVTEIRNIKLACKLADEIFKKIIKEIKIGQTEKHIGNMIEMMILAKKAHISFTPIVAFAQNSALPHHVSSNKKLTNNSIILLDFGVNINNYCSDMTRTIFFGKATNKQREIYIHVFNSQKKAIQKLKEMLISRIPLNASTIDKTARDYLTSFNFPSIPHSLGHGIGLEVHEKPSISPQSKSLLKAGMVFSIEPGVYIPKFGGVRIEDLIYFDGKKFHLLSHAKKQIIEI